ncbi:MAG: transcription antitermination factor NusB [Actinobacteria bacterium]|nr:transcription antitermination factor NusB [Actinomycetota bacterium]
MAKGKSRRSKQRRYALRILFEMDINETSAGEVLKAKRDAGESRPPDEFTVELVSGVDKHRAEIDRMISEYSEGWKLARMPGVDRNILRMSLYELFFMEDIPPGATIDEAVELAKAFSTSESGKFINGVLGRINRDREAGKRTCPSLPPTD